jgi:hypothetical protein
MFLAYFIELMDFNKVKPVLTHNFLSDLSLNIRFTEKMYLCMAFRNENRNQ